MPALKISYVVSFSSEDKLHVANNLLGNNASLKWKCKSPGEISAVVILQLEKASDISGIDIGNENSAYIEVHVSRSGGTEDYKTLLVMTSFMSAFESRESQNMNRVKMFKKEHFSSPECDEKWDRIKIICTQPFNRYVQYGLSFVKFHSNEVDKNVKNSKEMLGKFALRPESPIDLMNGTLFARKNEHVEQKDPQSPAAAIRDATYNILNKKESSPVPKLLPNCLKASTSKKANVNLDDTPIKPRNRNELLYTEDEEKPNAKIDSLIEKKNAEKKKLRDDKDKIVKNQEKDGKPNTSTSKIKEEEAQKKTPKRKEMKTPKKNDTVDKRTESLKRKIKDNNDVSVKKIRKGRTKPFYKLLEDVVLVISGIQNPDRANLRAKIMEMGAKYKPDWDDTCTHLVCAFMNTPKFNQVRGKGKIVTRKWVEECHSQRKKIPWRRYALDRQEKDKDESEEEINEEIEQPEEIAPISIEYDDTMEQPSDTEDRIERLQNSETSKLNEEIKVQNGGDVYSVDTDTDEETAERKQQIKKKPFDFFKNKSFFIDHNFEDDVEEMLRNYIFIHEGSLQDDLIEKIDYIICGRDEAKNLKDVNSGGICILPDWVVDCHKCRQFIPPDEYFIL